MHVDHLGRAAAFVQIVHILGDQGQIMPFCQIGQGAMRVVGFGIGGGCAAGVVKPMDQCGIADEGLGCGHILDPMVFP